MKKTSDKYGKNAISLREQHGMSKTAKGCIYAIICEFIYGLSYMFTKQATETASAFALLGWRFLIAAAAFNLLVLCGIVKIDLKGKSLKPLLIVAIFNPCFYFIAETIGINHTTASESGVILACIPIASLTASTLLLKKKPTKMQLTGILITMAGVLATVFAVGKTSSLSVTGYVLLFGAVVIYALYSVFVEKAEMFTGTEITYAMLMSGAALFIPLALIEAARTGNMETLLGLPISDMHFLSAIIYQGICCSVVAFFLSNLAIAYIGVNRTSSFLGISTVVSIVAGALLLQESFSAHQMIGVGVILLGVYTANASQ